MDGTSFHASPARRLISALVLTLCLFPLITEYLVGPYQVPTGSMAPALLGHHRAGVCPRCGFLVKVGRAQGDAGGAGGERYYARASCPNCGFGDLRLGECPETCGDQVLVNKCPPTLGAAHRWEIVVFRLFGKTFIKRLIGLGGEEIEIVDGDVYVDGVLARKTFEQVLGMRVLVFDNDCAPPGGWSERWLSANAAPVDCPRGGPLTLDAREASQELTYQHYFCDEHKCAAVGSEYAYNAENSRGAEAVHDFVVDAEIEIVAGKGALSVALTDGGLEAEIELPVGTTGVPVIRARPEGFDAGIARGARPAQLMAGKRYHLQMALVDRRLASRLDGVELCAPVDFPAPTRRDPVTMPLRLTARGVLVRCHHLRLYRDTHYTQAGANAVHGRPVHLAIDQTYVLGDNSANSEDSRFWPNHGMVPASAVVGRAILVHLPSRTATWQLGSRRWQVQLPDWGSMRWLH